MHKIPGCGFLLGCKDPREAVNVWTFEIFRWNYTKRSIENKTHYSVFRTSQHEAFATLLSIHVFTIENLYALVFSEKQHTTKRPFLLCTFQHMIIMFCDNDTSWMIVATVINALHSNGSSVWFWVNQHCSLKKKITFPFWASLQKLKSEENNSKLFKGEFKKVQKGTVFTISIH